MKAASLILKKTHTAQEALGLEDRDGRNESKALVRQEARIVVEHFPIDRIVQNRHKCSQYEQENKLLARAD